MSSPLEHISKGPLSHPPVDNLDHGPVEGIISKPVDVGPLPGESQDVDPDKQAETENSQQEHDTAGAGAVEDKEVTASPVEDKNIVAEPVEEKEVVAEPVVIDHPDNETLPKLEDAGLTTDGPAVLVDDKPTGQTVEVVDSAVTA